MCVTRRTEGALGVVEGDAPTTGGGNFPKTFEKDFLEIQEPSPGPSLSSYYKFIEGGRFILRKFAIPLFFELEAKGVRTHRWMQIDNSKKVEDLGLVEENFLEMGKELSEIREKESKIR